MISLVGATDLKRTLRNLSALMNVLMKEEELAMHASTQSSMGKLLRLGPISVSEKVFEENHRSKLHTPSDNAGRPL